MIYYDKFETWGPSFGDHITSIVGFSAIQDLTKRSFKYCEDAGDFIISRSNRDTMYRAIHAWILKNEYCVFHGTRLLPDEVVSVQQNGLKLLKASDREQRLREILSGHPRWLSVADRLLSIIEDLGPNEQNGSREGQVHFSLSRSGLVNCFNHYLKHGSEFDQHVVQKLFGDKSGLERLSAQTVPYLVHVKMSGEEIMRSAFPFFSYFEILEMGDPPGLARTFLNTWAFKTMNPSFEVDSLETDCCMMQKISTPPERIVLLERLRESGVQ